MLESRNITVEKLLSDKDFTGAKRAIEKLLRANKNDLIAHYYLALCEFYAGHMQEAERQAAALVQRDDRFAPAQYLLGLIFEHKAVHAYKKALSAGWKIASTKLDRLQQRCVSAGTGSFSAKKLSCQNCGALILPRTAAKTGGLCMPCFQEARTDFARTRRFSQGLVSPHLQTYQQTTTKVACKKCGRKILPRTAAKTGGLCMPCYQGWLRT